MILKKLEVILILRKIYQNNISEEKRMNKLMKLGLFILIAAYVISPADAIPGPLDDLVIMLLGMAANKKLNKNSQAAQSMNGKTVVESYGEYVD